MPSDFRTQRGGRRSLLLLATLAASPLLAQTADDPRLSEAELAAAAKEESIVLSPFVVNTNRDVGFVATSSLAGGRLAGELKDTPVAYSVLTREFIDAVGIDDLMTASEWTVNSTSLQGAGQEEIFGNGFETSSRGVSIGGQQRNFFPLAVNFDSYNLDRYDYSRGPNAILFGQGAFGGNANSVTKRAQFSGEPKTTVKVGYGSWDYRRYTLDDNRQLSDRLAIRTNLLWHEAQGWRDFELEQKKAITLAATWKITDRTELLLEGEAGRIVRNNPPTFLQDHFSGWDGVTTFAAPVSNKTVPKGSDMGLWGISRYGNDTSRTWVFAPDLGMTTVENLSNTMRTVGGNNAGNTPVGGIPVPTGAASVRIKGFPINDALNVAPWAYDAAIAGSRFRFPDSSFAMSTLDPTLKQTYQSYSAFLRNRLGDNFHLETAVNVASEHRRTQYMNGRGLNEVIIDINENLPDGRPNPQFLDMYGEGQRSRGSFGHEYASARVAAAYQLEQTRFGSHQFNLMAGVTQEENYQRIESMRVLMDADPRNWPYANAIDYRYYWNGPTRELPEIFEATANGVTYPVAWIGDSQRPTDISQVDIDVNYVQGAIKSRFFSDRLHTLFAFRSDEVTVKRTINDFYTDYPVDWQGGTGDYHYRPAAPDDYLLLPDVRPRDSKRIPTVTDGRYQDDFGPPDVNLRRTTLSTGAVYHVTPRLSVFANYAESFNPSTSQLRLDSSIVPSPVSKGTDYGLRFHLLKNRLNLSLTRYQGQETAQPFEISITSAILDIANANKVGDTSSDGINQAGVPIIPRQAFDLRDRENSGYELELTANITRDWRLTFNAAVADAEQTNAWRDTLAFIDRHGDALTQATIESGNVFDASGTPQTDYSVEADQRPDSGKSRSAWIKIFQGTLPNMELAPQKIPGLTEFTGNFFTDYRFSEGPLKGLTVGVGAQYRGKKVLTFRGADTIQDPNFPDDPTKAIDDPNVDAFTPVYSDPYLLTNATFGYTFRLKNRRTLGFHLAVSNLLNEDQVVFTGNTELRPPGGDYTKTAARVSTPVNFRYQVPRSWKLTATYSF